ncbi:MAG: hypothetical protein LJE84_05790 [Gammaproteobacteria bacterium]|jgi:hypothetical protein|nr:hypothetical protein [Gammaproteobacteria bacterium]
MARSWPVLGLLLLLAQPGASATAVAAEAASGRMRLRFDAPSPHAQVGNVVQRLTHRLHWFEIQSWLRATGGRFEGHAVDVSRETFEVYVPRRAPDPGGYSLFVWIHAIDDGAPRNDWLPVLEKLGVIYIGANDSGNGHSPVDRRIPLALHAAHNAQRRFPVNPDRVWVGGMSGGARTASLVAVAFADVFTGGLFAAGADPIGGRRLPLPPLPVLRQLQERSRLVSYTGHADTVNMLQVRQTHSSYDRYCAWYHKPMFDRRTEHANLDGRWLKKGLLLLRDGRPRTTAAQRLACRHELEERARSAIAGYQAAEPDQRAALAKKMDKDFGPLVASFLRAATDGSG